MSNVNGEGDHPRVGGEHVLLLVILRRLLGSPPRWRGAQVSRELTVDDWGITPALAGSTPPKCWPTCAESDHPRVGGEHRCLIMSDYVPKGSPPRWRGALGKAAGLGGEDRITPALAGSTYKWHRVNCGRADHPRVGGEHAQIYDDSEVYEGSPPRWRGARTAAMAIGLVVGITPALAGSTCRSCVT